MHKETLDSLRQEYAAKILIPNVECTGGVVSVRRKGKRRVVMHFDTGETRIDIIPQEVLLRGNVAAYLESLIGSMFVQIDWAINGLRLEDRSPVNMNLLHEAVAKELKSRLAAKLYSMSEGGDSVQSL